jgi:hypothetical protein
MPPGHKSSDADQPKCVAAQIEAADEKKGVSLKNAETRATINQPSGGGQKSGPGRKN